MFNKDTFLDMKDGDYFLGLGPVNEGDYLGYKFSNRRLNFISIKNGEAKANFYNVKTSICEDQKLDEIPIGHKIYILFDQFRKVSVVNPV